MKILVGIKRVVDYAVKVRVNKGSVDLANVKQSMNPFCEVSFPSEDTSHVEIEGLDCMKFCVECEFMREMSSPRFINSSFICPNDCLSI